MGKTTSSSAIKRVLQGLSGVVDLKHVLMSYTPSPWVDDSTVSNMWAGLLALACSKEGLDDSSLIFINILSQITSLQAKIINYACNTVEVKLSKKGGIYCDMPRVSISKVFGITGCNDIHRVDRELDQLRSLELIGSGIGGGGFTIELDNADISPQPLALHFYARCQGWACKVEDYYNAQPDET